MTIAVDMGRKATKTNKQKELHGRLRQAITVSGLDPPIQSLDVCM